MPKPIIDYIAGDGTAKKIDDAGTGALSKVTGISKENLKKKTPSLMDRYGKKVANVITRPLSKTVQLYTTPEYQQQKLDEQNPKSPRYKKNLIDRFVDRTLSPY